MRKLITILLLIVAINKSYSCDSCFIKLNQKYLLKTDSLIASLTFVNDSVYLLRGEKAQDKWVSYGKWYKRSDTSILINPNKGGLKINEGKKSRISKIDGIYFFNLKDETIEIRCIKSEIDIIIEGYIFKRNK